MPGAFLAGIVNTYILQYVPVTEHPLLLRPVVVL